MKTCHKCNQSKPFNEFSKDKKKLDGYYSSCKACKSLVNAKFYNVNIESERERGVAKYQSNKIKYQASTKRYQKANPDKRRHWKAKYRAAKLQATVEGFNSELLEIYKNCPEGLHVDHIVPLQSDLVCGLHVPWNLQYLTPEENLKKSNKLI